MELIELHNVYKTYHLGEIDVPVLKGVSMKIAHGEMVALMGASGSGKSTLMNILGCLDRPTSGEYWLDGQEVSKFSSDARALVRNRKIGFVFQSFNLLPCVALMDRNCARSGDFFFSRSFWCQNSPTDSAEPPFISPSP